jgi:hypothetical protein
MKRREFITLVGGAAAWPLAARAQHGARLRRLGVLIPYAESDAEAQSEIAAFRQTLEQLGWRDGRNLAIEYRWASGDTSRIRAYAKELVALAPDAIFCRTTPVTAAFAQETRTIPIVFVNVSDPVGAGFAASIAQESGAGLIVQPDVTTTAPAGGLSVPLLRRRGRPRVLRHQRRRLVPARGGLRRSHPQGREAGRPAGAGAGQVRAGHQPQDRQNAWRNSSSDTATRCR